MLSYAYSLVQLIPIALFQIFDSQLIEYGLLDLSIRRFVFAKAFWIIVVKF